MRCFIGNLFHVGVYLAANPGAQMEHPGGADAVRTALRDADEDDMFAMVVDMEEM